MVSLGSLMLLHSGQALIENMTLGTAAVGYLTESMHGAGSPQAQRIMIGRRVNMAEKKKTLLQGTIDVHPHQPGERCVLVPIASGEFCSESQVVTFEVTAILNGQ